MEKQESLQQAKAVKAAHERRAMRRQSDIARNEIAAEGLRELLEKVDAWEREEGPKDWITNYRKIVQRAIDSI